jgi:hypothetical protein
MKYDLLSICKSGNISHGKEWITLPQYNNAEKYNEQPQKPRRIEVQPKFDLTIM